MLPLPSGRHFEKPGLKQFTTAESGTRISAELQGTLQSTFMQLFFKHLTHWKKKKHKKERSANYCLVFAKYTKASLRVF